MIVRQNMCKRSNGEEPGIESAEELGSSQVQPKMSLGNQAAAHDIVGIMQDASKPLSPDLDSNSSGPGKTESDNTLAVVKAASAHRPAPPPPNGGGSSRDNQYVPGPQHMPYCRKCNRQGCFHFRRGFAHLLAQNQVPPTSFYPLNDSCPLHIFQ